VNDFTVWTSGVGGIGGVTGGTIGVGGVGGVTGGTTGVGGVGGVTLLLNSVSAGNSVVAINTLPSFFTLIPTVAIMWSYSIPASVPFTSSTW